MSVGHLIVSCLFFFVCVNGRGKVWNLQDAGVRHEVRRDGFHCCIDRIDEIYVTRSIRGGYCRLGRKLGAKVLQT